MYDNEWKRYLIMNTANSPAIAQQNVEKIVNKRELIDLNSIECDDYKMPTFEELMEGL